MPTEEGHFIFSDYCAEWMMQGFSVTLQLTISLLYKELMEEFAKTIKRDKNLGYIFKLANVSDEMLSARFVNMKANFISSQTIREKYTSR